MNHHPLSRTQALVFLYSRKYPLLAHFFFFGGGGGGGGGGGVEGGGIPKSPQFFLRKYLGLLEKQLKILPKSSQFSSIFIPKKSSNPALW